MNYLVIYYGAQDGDTRALLVHNEAERPDGIPAKMVADGVIENETDVHAILGTDFVGMRQCESNGFLMINCAFEETQDVPVADYE
jgi:hypothetical protein